MKVQNRSKGFDLSLATSVFCLYIIIFAYYTMIFRQINHQIHLISKEKLTLFKRKKIIINKTKQRQLISLIEQHNLAAIEIHKFNLMARRTVGCLFINFAIIKIISFYLIVKSNEFFVELFLIVLNILLLILLFGVSFLFTLQIKSAHQPVKTIYSIVCKYRINLRFKLKVSKIVITY